MSSFYCEICGKNIIDTQRGYITGCEHHPIEKKRRSNMQQVEFAFKPGSKVINPLGKIGYVDSASIDDAGEKKYYVIGTGDGGNWWAEKSLRAQE
ncbi:MAG: hypothetical protein GQ578_09720 [Desulfuromonadaceae bacterium]|nr:hypothetical protein [Desulfuromonadaceae bacterium]